MVSQPQNSAPPRDTVSQLSQESLPEALSSFLLQDPDPQAGVWDEVPHQPPLTKQTRGRCCDDSQRRPEAGSHLPLVSHLPHVLQTRICVNKTDSG